MFCTAPCCCRCNHFVGTSVKVAGEADVLHPFFGLQLRTSVSEEIPVMSRCSMTDSFIHLCPEIFGTIVLADATAQQLNIICAASNACWCLKQRIPAPTLIAPFCVWYLTRGGDPCSRRGSRGGTCLQRQGELLWQPMEPEIPTGILRLSKEDHSALRAALPFPSLHVLFFLPISPPVLINICFIHLIPMEIWQQVAKIKIYKINE